METLINPPARNKTAALGFGLSLSGFLSVFLPGVGTWMEQRTGITGIGILISSTGVTLAFLSIPGFLISVMAALRGPSRLARWGIVFGAFTFLFLPTFYLSILWSLRAM